MKRANGTGTVVKLSGNRSRPYCVRISQRDKRGYVIQTAVSYHAKAAEAQAALDELVKKIQAGNHISADTINTTWGQAYEIWSARKYTIAAVSYTHLSYITRPVRWSSRRRVWR